MPLRLKYSLIPTQTGECTSLKCNNAKIMWMELVENQDAAYLKSLVIMMSCLDDNPKLIMLMHPSAIQVSVIIKSIKCMYSQKSTYIIYIWTMVG